MEHCTKKEIASQKVLNLGESPETEKETARCVRICVSIFINHGAIDFSRCSRLHCDVLLLFLGTTNTYFRVTFDTSDLIFV